MKRNVIIYCTRNQIYDKLIDIWYKSLVLAQRSLTPAYMIYGLEEVNIHINLLICYFFCSLRSQQLQ